MKMPVGLGLNDASGNCSPRRDTHGTTKDGTPNLVCRGPDKPRRDSVDGIIQVSLRQ